MTAPTPPIAGFASATPIVSPSYQSLQISGTAQGQGIGEALAGAVAANLIANGTTVVNKQNGQVFWQISITDMTGKTFYATTGDWIVVGLDASGNMQSIKIYNGPNPTYQDNPPYTGVFT